MAEIIEAKNLTAGALPLEQLSVLDGVLPALATTNLTDYNNTSRIKADAQLYDYITNDQVVLVVEGVELTKEESLQSQGGSSAFIQLVDTPSDYTTVGAEFLRVNGTNDGVDYDHVTFANMGPGTLDDLNQILSDAGLSNSHRIGWSYLPSFNGLVTILGFHDQSDTGVSLVTGAPETYSVPLFDAQVALNLSAAVGLPFTIRLTGTSIDHTTQVLSVGDTEDIPVDANGWYLTTKFWVDEVAVDIVEALKSATADFYRVAAWVPPFPITVEKFKVEFEPDSPAWDFDLELVRTNIDGSATIIDSFTFANTDTPPRADNGVLGRYYRTGLSITVDPVLNQGLVLRAPDQSGIRNFYLEITYST